jgi:hypothetical protein
VCNWTRLLQEPLQNLEGTSEEAIIDYENSHPDVPVFDCIENSTHEVSDELAAAVDSFYRQPSRAGYEDIAAAAGSVPQPRLYTSAVRWLLGVAANADTEEDMAYYTVLVDIYIAKGDLQGLDALVGQVLPLRPHNFGCAARWVCTQPDNHGPFCLAGMF